MKDTVIHFLYSLCILSLLIFSVVSYHNSNVLESRINSLNKNGKDFNSEKTFKEDYYIKQQSSDTTLLLVVFPIIVGFIALFTYKDIFQKVVAYETKIQTKIEEQETEWNKNHSLILELKARMDLDSSQSNFSHSSYFFHEEDYEYYISSFLDGVKFKVYHSLWMSDKFPDTKDILVKEVISQLKKFLKIINTIEIPETLSNFQLTELNKEIRKINNDEVDNLLSLIYSKLTPIKTV
ncbi:MAG: hypothetical protein DCF13_11680 [Flavobacteriaceae bacterium]|nr:MAG: hypothetical protein DCF13_11680 [Flavobacteriaceae bacterium]